MSPIAAPDPADHCLSAYSFDLPEQFIAQRPAEPRHAARLLAVDPLTAGEQALAPGAAAPCRHLTVWELQQELQPGDLLVVNNTRVLKARLQALRQCVGTEKTGRETGRREAEPPELAQITETVVPLVPWKYRAIA